ncbi:hypothetical protein QQ045_010488 [Rhodiola kirilowii]
MTYFLYGPFAAKVIYSWAQDELLNDKGTQCRLGVLILSFVRYFVHDDWSSFNAMLFLNHNRRIIKKGINFKQIDQEWDWYLTDLL